MNLMIGLVTNAYLITLPRSFLSSQRKLSAPEYKNVDEEHRVAMIKHETTQMAVRDLDKYHSAVDKVRRSFITLYEREEPNLTIFSSNLGVGVASFPQP